MRNEWGFWLAFVACDTVKHSVAWITTIRIIIQKIKNSWAHSLLYRCVVVWPQSDCNATPIVIAHFYIVLTECVGYLCGVQSGSGFSGFFIEQAFNERISASIIFVLNWIEVNPSVPTLDHLKEILMSRHSCVGAWTATSDVLHRVEQNRPTLVLRFLVSSQRTALS